MSSRSTVVAGRPARGRSAAACPSVVSRGWGAGQVPALLPVLALALVLAVLWAAPAPANDPVEAQPVAGAGTDVAAATEAPVVDVGAAEPGAVEPEPVEAVPAPPPAEPAPAPDPAPEATAPTGSVEPVDPAVPAPEAEAEPVALAHNQSRTVQAVLQFQRGCQTHCYGTTLTQDASQRSQTDQTAHSDSTGTGSGAAAMNESSTAQFIWQVQLGCVAFCFDTSQSQTASQSAQTTQSATALSDALASAVNAAETLQLVFQYQQGCEQECHGASSSQSVAQNQGVRQSATAERRDGLLGWLVALAENLGVTLQTVLQYQDADCLEFCFGDSQTQAALQEALTAQQAQAGKPPGRGPAAAGQPRVAPAGPTEPSRGAAVAPAPPPEAAPAQGALRERSRRRTTNRRLHVTVNAGFTQTRSATGSAVGHTESREPRGDADGAAYRGYAKVDHKAYQRSSTSSAVSSSTSTDVRAFAGPAELRSQKGTSSTTGIAAGLLALVAGLGLLLFRRPSLHPGV